MKKNLIFRLFLSVILFTLFHSCIHDETLASSDPYSKKYTNKSLWKEDETYIKNIMKIYEQNEGEIKKINGKPLWDYAMTMGHTDESFLIVPIAEGNTIVSCMQVPRNLNSIRFIYDKDQSHINFFQIYTTAKKIKPVEEINILPSNKGKLVLCSYSAVSVFIPDSEGNPNGPGHWEVVQYITTCSENPGEGSSCSGYYDSYGNCVPQGYTPPTYPYTPGGGGNGTNTTQDPCKKLKVQNTNPNFKAKIDLLVTKVGLKKETGYAESKSGVFTELSPAVSTASSDGMTVTVTPDLKGYIHTHLNDYETGKVTDDGYTEINQPIRMFSPADVNTLMTMAEMASNGNYTDLYGTMVSSSGNYTIMFSGTGSDIKTGFDTEYWRLEYQRYKKDNPYWTFEKLFLNFLKYKMNVKGVDLYKIKSNGTVQKKTLNSNNKVDSNDCP